VAYEGNRYAGLNHKGQNEPNAFEKLAAPVGTAVGAGAGFLLGGPPGMMAGAQLGGSIGGAAGSASQGTLTPQGVAGDVMGDVSGFNGLKSAMNNRSILEAFMRDPSQFKVGFANGGLVTGPAMDPASQWETMDPVQRAMAQAQQAVGPAPTAPTTDNGGLGTLRQAQHPTLEALSALLPKIMEAMPRPANPKNTKAIGAWLPAAGLALSAPAAIAQSRRATANAPITAANTAAQSDYEAKRKAYEDRKTKIADTLVGNATKPFAPDNPSAAETPITPDEAKRMGHPEWAGMMRRDVSLRLQGMPDRPKPVEPPSPKEKASLANMLADNIRQDKDVSNFMVVRDNYSRIARMAANGSGVGDMSLIFAYMKVLDPTSVVRESEYKNAADAIGKIPQLANIPANWMVGSKLTPEGRAGFVKAAKELYEQQRASYRTAIDMYKGFAAEFGIDPRLVIRNYEVQDIPDMGGGQAVPVGPTPAAAGRRTK